MFVKDSTLTDNNRWPLALVTATLSGSDKLVRAVDIKCGKKTYRRGVNRLIKLYLRILIQQYSQQQHRVYQAVQLQHQMAAQPQLQHQPGGVCLGLWSAMCTKIGKNSNAKKSCRFSKLPPDLLNQEHGLLNQKQDLVNLLSTPLR